jgi:hypothetical protein
VPAVPVTRVRVLRFWYLTWTLPLTAGARRRTPSISSRIACASATVRVCCVPDITPWEPLCPGRTTSRFVPMAEMRVMICFSAPATMASIEITAPTPMMMPSIVRNERRGFPMRLLRPTLTMVQNSMRPPCSFYFVVLVVRQR